MPILPDPLDMGRSEPVATRIRGSGIPRDVVADPPTIYEKIAALTELSRHIGLLDWPRGRGRTTEQIEQISERIPLADLMCALATIASPNSTAIERHACDLILQMVWPDWRKNALPWVNGRLVSRNSSEVHEWRAAVLERDGHRCQHCGSGKKLHAHHIIHWAAAPDLRVDVDNGITLCQECHALEHTPIANLILSAIKEVAP